VLEALGCVGARHQLAVVVDDARLRIQGRGRIDEQLEVAGERAAMGKVANRVRVHRDSQASDHEHGRSVTRLDPPLHRSCLLRTSG